MNKQITEDYCSFEIAKLLGEKGFDACVYTCYSVEDYPQFMTMVDYVVQDEVYELIGKDCHIIQAPTHQMALKWLREVHNFIVLIEYDIFTDKFYCYIRKRFSNYIIPTDSFNSYEEAVEAALKYSLENLI